MAQPTTELRKLPDCLRELREPWHGTDFPADIQEFMHNAEELPHLAETEEAAAQRGKAAKAFKSWTGVDPSTIQTMDEFKSAVAQYKSGQKWIAGVHYLISVPPEASIEVRDGIISPLMQGDDLLLKKKAGEAFGKIFWGHPVLLYRTGRDGTKEWDAEFNKQYFTLLERDLMLRGVTAQIAAGGRAKRDNIPRDVYSTIMDVLKILPAQHVGQKHIEKLVLGGSSPEGELVPVQYQDPALHIYDAALEGVRRNLPALLVREIGRALLEILKEYNGPMSSNLENSREALALRSKWVEQSVPVAVDYMLGPEHNMRQAVKSLPDFAAETYLTYVVRGCDLKTMAEAMPYGPKQIWAAIYEIHKASARAEFE